MQVQRLGVAGIENEVQAARLQRRLRHQHAGRVAGADGIARGDDGALADGFDPWRGGLAPVAEVGAERKLDLTRDQGVAGAQPPGLGGGARQGPDCF